MATRGKTRVHPRRVRCHNWPKLGEDKTPKYCGRPFCPVHGRDERLRRCQHMLQQLPRDLCFYSWIVHVDAKLSSGCQARELGDIFDALRRGVRKFDPAARVYALPHWLYGHVHLHILLFVPPGVTPDRCELANSVRDALRARGRHTLPERRADLAVALHFKELWPASKQSPDAALLYAAQIWDNLTWENLPARSVKKIPFAYGFKKIDSRKRADASVLKVKTVNALPFSSNAESPTTRASDDEPTTNANNARKANGIAPSRTERPKLQAVEVTVRAIATASNPYNKVTAAPTMLAKVRADDAPSSQDCPLNDPNLSSFIWAVADLLRGDYKQSEYGKVILPFTVLRRLDCVLEPTKEAVLAELAKWTQAKLNPEPFLLKKSGQLFFNTSPLDMKRLMGDQDHIQENVLAYIEGFSAAVRDIFESFEFAKQIDCLGKAGLLYLVAEKFATIDLHPEAVSNAQMGTVFEELIRKFAELSNETAGEHFTSREVIRLMVNLIFAEDDAALTKPGVVRSLYDPTAGTGGMLSVAGEHLAEMNPGARLVMYGQELNAESYAICKADMLIKGQDIANIIFGNTLSADGLSGKHFDYMLSNPPFGVEWKKIQKEIEKEHEQLGYNGRFGPGLPRVSDGSL